MPASTFGDPGKNDFKIESELGEPVGEYTGTQSSKKAAANDKANKPPSLADQMMQTGRQY
jgi:hypothetical protein